MPVSDKVAFKAQSIKIEPTYIPLFNKYLLYITVGVIHEAFDKTTMTVVEYIFKL